MGESGREISQVQTDSACMCSEQSLISYVFPLQDWSSCWQFDVSTSALDHPEKHRSSSHWILPNGQACSRVFCSPGIAMQKSAGKACALESNRPPFEILLISLAERCWMSYFSFSSNETRVNNVCLPGLLDNYRKQHAMLDQGLA